MPIARRIRRNHNENELRLRYVVFRTHKKTRMAGYVVNASMALLGRRGVDRRLTLLGHVLVENVLYVSGTAATARCDPQTLAERVKTVDTPGRGAADLLVCYGIANADVHNSVT